MESMVIWPKNTVAGVKNHEDILKTEGSPELRFRTVLDILHTASVINNMHLKFLKPFNLSVQQYNILRILRSSYPDSLTVQEIKEQMVDRTPNTTRMVDKLLLQKLVTRVRSNKDRRKVYVKITDQGLEIMSKTDIILKDFMKITDNLSSSETNQLSCLLEKLR